MAPKKSPKFHASDIQDLSGYVAMVTGGNTGIGYEITLQLALHNARVYLAARSPERANKAIAQMKSSHKQNLDLHFLEIDLQSLQSVKSAADTFMKTETRLDLLINNAGIMAVSFKLTTDGFETQWQTNHLAPFFLVNCLLPILESTAASTSARSRVRIVNVSSDAAFMTAPKEMDLAHPNLENVKGAMAGWKRYGHSKQASIIHARALHDRFHKNGISAFAVQPGIVNTNLTDNDPSAFGFFVRYMIRWGIMPGTVSVAEGATSTLFCATSEKAVGDSGKYFAPGGVLDKRPEKWTGDAKVVGRLWEE
ncbi:hypothetical protein P7C71_g4435, partial [Lecanoromycetidae sp. Uapishka_2]